MSPKYDTAFYVATSWHLSTLRGFTKEAILLNRVCGHGQKWCHWICKGWGYHWSEIHFHLWFLQNTITLQKQHKSVSDTAGPRP